MSDRIRRYKRGERIDRDLTVLGVIADVRGRHPVYLVWSDERWCALACKIQRSFRRARHEAEVLDAVTHPNIVRQLGAREPAILLMEYLNGPTLDAVAETKPQGRLSLPDGLRAAIHVGSALHHAHSQGYLHLDVKPSNVIVSGGRPILYDFGAARRIDAERPDHIVGTDAYIAPEECLLQPTGPAADVFGLGVSLYELLTGEMPFPDGTRRRPYPQLDGAPVPLRAHLPRAPEGLERLLTASMDRDPARRPPLAELLPALHGFIRSGPRMWPADFRPGAPSARSRSRSSPLGGTVFPKQQESGAAIAPLG